SSPAPPRTRRSADGGRRDVGHLESIFRLTSREGIAHPPRTLCPPLRLSHEPATLSPDRTWGRAALPPPSEQRVAAAMATEIFVSYASENRTYQSDITLFKGFVDDVVNEVNQTR